jgi:hypothetical protein
MNEQGLASLPFSRIYILLTSKTKQPLKIWKESALLPPKINIS